MTLKTIINRHFTHHLKSDSHHLLPAYLSDSLRPTSEIVACRCLRSADTTTLQVPSTRRATLGDRAFPVATARAWNSLPLDTRRACSSLLTFLRETKSHLFRQSYGWRSAVGVYSDGQQTSALSCATFRSKFCKVPPQLCDGSTVIHDIVVVVELHLQAPP